MLSVAAWRQGRWHPASAACLARWRRLGWNGLARSLRPVESGRLRPAAATGTRVEFQLLLSHGDVLAALGRPHEAAETCLQTADLVTIDIHDVVAAPLPDIRRLEHADLLHPVLAPSSAGGAAAVPRQARSNGAGRRPRDPIMPSKARMAPTTMTIPIVQTMAIFAMKPIMRRIMPRIIMGTSSWRPPYRTEARIFRCGGGRDPEFGWHGLGSQPRIMLPV